MKQAFLVVCALLFSGISHADQIQVICTDNSNSDYFIRLTIENGVPTVAALGNQDWSQLGPDQSLDNEGRGRYFVTTPASGLGLGQGDVLTIPASIAAGQGGELTANGVPYTCR
jgi:hypothetical protein